MRKGRPFLVMMSALLLVSGGDAEEGKQNCECAQQCLSRASVIMGEEHSVEYMVEGMRCAGCAQGLEQKLSSIEGVKVEGVSNEKGSVKLRYKEGEVGPEEVIERIEQEGYRVVGERVALKVEGMTCEGCESGLRETVLKIKGVDAVERVSYQSGALEFTVSLAACKATIFKKIKEAGYVICSQQH